TEGISPIGWLYMDDRYIRSVHERYGRLPMKTFPGMPLRQFLRWGAVRGIRRVRPLYHVDYHKEQTKEFLASEMGWTWYGGHHLENRFTAFYHTHVLPRRFGIDTRSLGWSALIRSGQLPKEEALEMISVAPECPREILDLVRKRLEFDEDEFERVMTLPVQTHENFETYRTTFRRLKPVFWLLYKFDRVPKSFYLKFVKG